MAFTLEGQDFRANARIDQPVLGFLDHPSDLNWRIEKGPDGKDQQVYKKTGYSIIPTFGFSIGKTYQRRNPAAVITPSDTVRRFNFGLDMNFDLSQYISLSIEDTMYIRGEAEDDRFHNYFKGGIEAPLGRLSSSAVNSLFMTVERGNQPPFATRDANVFKIGYRIRADN